MRAAERAFAAWGEVEQERTAIVGHDGKIPREWAEGFARLDTDRVDRKRDSKPNFGGRMLDRQSPTT